VRLLAWRRQQPPTGADSVVIELIWNSIDADAQSIEVVLARDSVHSMVIGDNGHGITRQVAATT
jgi:DNA mismatch repair ATPase MutL